MVRLVLGCILAVLPLAAGMGDIPHAEFKGRREALRKTVDGVIVLFGQRETNDEIYRFQQEPNFLYLSGWQEPGAILLLTPSKDALFLPHHDEHAERFLGKRTSAEDQSISAITGF